MKKIRTILPLLFVLLSGTTPMMAQDTQDEAMHRLQARMDELRSQMTQIQAELDAMHGVNNLANAVTDLKPVPAPLQTGAIERTMPPLPPAMQLPPEQQRMAVGRATAEYETFSACSTRGRPVCRTRLSLPPFRFHRQRVPTTSTPSGRADFRQTFIFPSAI